MAKTRYRYMVPWDPKSPEEWAAELEIEPLEPLTITRRAYDHMLGDEPYHTVETRWTGLLRLTDRRGERVLADECAVMDSGPKLGATLCITNHPEREATVVAVAKTRYRYMVPWDPKSPEEWAAELEIEPLEPLTITRRAYDHMLGDEPYHTVETRWTGLLRLTDRRGERVLADECAVMDSGPKLGTTLCITNHPEREATEEERARNWENLQEVGNQVMRRMGIW